MCKKYRGTFAKPEVHPIRNPHLAPLPVRWISQTLRREKVKDEEESQKTGKQLLISS